MMMERFLKCMNVNVVMGYLVWLLVTTVMIYFTFKGKRGSAFLLLVTGRLSTTALWAFQLLSFRLGRLWAVPVRRAQFENNLEGD